MSTENRRPHTVYLTDDLWKALERGHLQLRLATSSPLSKIDFIEQVLQTGLDAVMVRAQVDGEHPVPPGRDVAAHDGVGRAISPKQEGRRGRRPSAVERLRQASEPGRPAHIRSAADGDEESNTTA